MTTTDTPTAQDRQNARLELKRRVTSALKRRYPRSTETTDGFSYSDDSTRGKHAFYAHDRENPERVGLLLAWDSRELWRSGEYRLATHASRVKTFELAAFLTELGFTVDVQVNSTGDSGHVVIWADENA